MQIGDATVQCAHDSVYHSFRATVMVRFQYTLTPPPPKKRDHKRDFQWICLVPHLYKMRTHKRMRMPRYTKASVFIKNESATSGENGNNDPTLVQ